MNINATFVEKILTTFIKEELAKFKYKKGIVGLSGGIDSFVCAALAAKALNPVNVIALIMPYGTFFQQDTQDAKELAQMLQIRSKIIDIAPMVDAYFSSYPTENRITKGNKMGSRLYLWK